MRRTRIHGMASHALELPAGTIEATRTEIGDGLLWSPIEETETVIQLSMLDDDKTSRPSQLRKGA